MLASPPVEHILSHGKVRLQRAGLAGKILSDWMYLRCNMHFVTTSDSDIAFCVTLYCLQYDLNTTFEGALDLASYIMSLAFDNVSLTPTLPFF